MLHIEAGSLRRHPVALLQRFYAEQTSWMPSLIQAYGCITTEKPNVKYPDASSKVWVVHEHRRITVLVFDNV